MFKRSVFVPFVAAMVFGVAAALVLPAAAATACKGKAVADCRADNQCRWVEPYTRKDGAEVSGYCRATPATGKKVSRAGD